MGWFLADISCTGNIAASALTCATSVRECFTFDKRHTLVLTRPTRLNKRNS